VRCPARPTVHREELVGDGKLGAVLGRATMK